MAFSRITLASGGRTVSGELVIETVNAYQVAVDGSVGVYLKDEWRPSQGGDWSDLLGDIGDLLGKR